MLRSPRSPALALAALLVLGSACSGGDDIPDRAQTVDPAQTSSSTAAPTASTTTTVDPASLTEADLQGTLLTLEDMPSGFSQLPPDDEDSPTPYCDGRDPAAEVPEIAETEVQFVQDPTTGPLISSAAGAYATSDEASRYIGAILSAAQQCPGPYPTPGNDGDTTTIAPLSFGTYGDETAAIRVTLEGGLLPFTADLVFVREGPVVFQVAEATSVGGSDVERLEGLAQTQLGRTAALLSGP